MHRLTTFRLGIAVAVLVGGLMVQAAVAQHSEPHCDLEALLAHQIEHAQELEHFDEAAEADLGAALATLYRTGIAYQVLAVECGFIDQLEVEATHEAEHAAAESQDHDEAAERLEIARSVGDPEAGEELFNTLQTEVAFACATCHRVDTTEMLIGPGLLGVGSPTHDPSAHGAEAGGHDDHDAEATAEAAGGHDDHAEEATPAVERTIEETITYLHTSIVDPSAYIVPGFVDNLMPKVYGEILTEEEINNLVAYLLTL